MGKYFTRRCVLLHVLVVVLVPAFLVAGWWQYEVARSGNTLSWVYTVEWPFFALYALYVWWRMIHDQSTLFDRMWAARQRAAADATGTPLHEIPGWAMDKALAREVVQASLQGPRAAALGPAARGVLGAGPAPAMPETVHWPVEARLGELSTASAPGDPRAAGADGACPDEAQPADAHADAQPAAAEAEGDAADADGPQRDGDALIDARVLEVRANVDEDLHAYNRYLADLALRDPPKRWRTGAMRRGAGPGTEPR